MKWDFQSAEENNCQPKILYAAKLFKSKSKVDISGVKIFRAFITHIKDQRN